jgi:formylglycine-generating enzyme required for sulfatase activity
VLWEQVQDGAREPWIEERARAPDLSREEDLPETGQPWASTLAFCNRLSSWCELAPAYQFGLDDARNVVTWRGLDHEGWRLPTEAEWELACRAGWGEPPSWSYPGPAREDLFPAREAPPNRLGLFGMKGLALEWVWDAPSGDHTSASADPTGPLVVSASRPMPRRDRILKGALFSAAADSPQWHPAWRSSMLEATAYEGIAFRCARSLLLD